MRGFQLAITFVSIVGLTACEPAPDAIMPEVVGKQLDVAKSDIERAGFGGEIEVLGGGMFGVLDESNWQVCEQEPAAGQIVAEPRLVIDRSCGNPPAESTTAPTETASSPTKTANTQSESPTAAPTQSAEETESVLTVKNNEDLKELLTNNDIEAHEAFVEKYMGRTIQFDGNIARMDNSGNYKTRYDILITAGDYSEKNAQGPSFQFEDVNITDLHLTGSDIPDTIGMGDHIRVTAKVVGVKDPLVFLEPVSTEMR